MDKPDEPQEKTKFSRRILLRGAGKLAYVAPVLTLISVVTPSAHAISLPPCSPNESPPGCTPTAAPTSSKRKSRTGSKRKPPDG